MVTIVVEWLNIISYYFITPACSLFDFLQRAELWSIDTDCIVVGGLM